MDIDPPTPTFTGARNASTTSAWAQRPRLQADAPFSSSYRGFSLKMKETSGNALEIASSDPVAFIEGVETVRIYVTLDEMPFARLDALHVHLQDSPDLKKIHICIQSLLRPALLRVHENFGLERALVATIRKWAATNTALEFQFLWPNVTTTCEDVDGFQKVNFFTAIKGLAKGSVELTQILDQAERCAAPVHTSASDLKDDAGEGGMEKDDYL